MANIISASKRTDIPAFYAEWFINRVKAGYVLYRNPFNLKQSIKVSLLPSDVLAVSFWTRNPEPLLKYLDFLDNSGINFYFHFTINNFPREIDPSTPQTNKMIDVFKRISDRYSPKHVQWRYDPIIFNSKMTPEWHLENFGILSSKLQGATERCYFSYVDYYRKTSKHLLELENRGEYKFYDSNRTNLEIIGHSKKLNEIATENRIQLFACAEPLVDKEIKEGGLSGIKKASCVDIDIIKGLFPSKFQNENIRPTRDSCGCYPCKDIGAYDSCMYKCIYCYANADFETKSKTRLYNHNSESEYLIDEIVKIEVRTEQKKKPEPPTLFD